MYNGAGFGFQSSPSMPWLNSQPGGPGMSGNPAYLGNQNFSHQRIPLFSKSENHNLPQRPNAPNPYAPPPTIYLPNMPAQVMDDRTLNSQIMSLANQRQGLRFFPEQRNQVTGQLNQLEREQDLRVYNEKFGENQTSISQVIALKDNIRNLEAQLDLINDQKDSALQKTYEAVAGFPELNGAFAQTSQTYDMQIMQLQNQINYAQGQISNLERTYTVKKQPDSLNSDFLNLLSNTFSGMFKPAQTTPQQQNNPLEQLLNLFSGLFK